MIDDHTFCEIHRLQDQEHLNVNQIAVQLQLAYQTVEKWAAPTPYQKAQQPPRPSKLDAFKGPILALLHRHPYTAQQILQELKTQGYAGGYSILKDFVRQVRPARKPAFLKLEFAPGECAQADWGSFGSVAVGSTRRRLSFFVMVLCYSRLMYVEFTLSEGMEQFLTCHRHALEFFGLVPQKVMIDNLKVGVLRHPLGQPAQFHPRYLDFAAHYGFQPVACNVRRANEKGRVESGVGYIKINFLRGLQIPSFPAVNPAARQWLDSVANVRLHGETQRKPVDLFAEEKPHLQPLPVLPYDCAVVRPSGAHGCCRVAFDANRYSVPYLYASQKLTLKIYPDQLLIYHQEKLIATPLRSDDRRQDIRDPDHAKELLVQRQRPNPVAGLPPTESPGRTLRAQAPGKAAPGSSPRPENHGAERNLRTGQTGPCPPRCPELRRLRFGIHRQHARTARAHPRHPRGPAFNPATRPVGLGPAARRPEPLRT